MRIASFLTVTLLLSVSSTIRMVAQEEGVTAKDTTLVRQVVGQPGSDPLDADALFIKSIFDRSLTTGRAYDWLRVLSEEIGGRLAGSPQAAAAVEYTLQELRALEVDTAWLQPCRVPHWERGDPEVVRIVNSPQVGTVDLHALALGNSIGTGPSGLSAEVIEVHSLEALKKLGREQVSGKIVFFNRPFDDTQIRTFYAYGKAVDQRGNGPSVASGLGAVGVLVRSMTNAVDDIPHTGVTIFADGVKNIPSLAISTRDANLLSSVLRQGPARVYIRNTSRMYPDKISYNVVAEIRGSEYPDEIILVGGHLDSWDVGGGAHDDGAGCAQSMDVLYLLGSLGHRPRRTIRCVLFMNEENGLEGAREYARSSNERGEFHLFALESDAGGFTPHGFSCDADDSVFVSRYRKLTAWLPLLEPYHLYLSKGGSGADISQLKSQLGLLCGLRPDSQRYFDYHHTERDRIDAVHPRELALGSGAMAALVYLVDKYGLTD